MKCRGCVVANVLQYPPEILIECTEKAWEVVIEKYADSGSPSTEAWLEPSFLERS
jgi:hypothetical protein